MADDLEGPWETEDVPPDSKDVVYVRVYGPTDVDRFGKPASGIFTIRGTPEHYGMSSDWCRHCADADETRRRSKTHSYLDYGVIALPIDKIRNLQIDLEYADDSGLGQDVQHDPVFFAPRHEDNNRAHTNVTGPKSRDDIRASPCRQEIHSHAKAYSQAIRAQLREIASWVIYPPGVDDGTQ